VALRPPREDLYRDLGVPRNATGEELNAAFRARAKVLHPDARGGDAVATEAFKRVSLAYSVLRDPVQRARYDSGILVLAPAAGEPAPAAASRRPRFTRRAARATLAAGIVLVLLGVLAAAWVISLQRSDADLLAGGVPTRAVVVQADGERRFEFTTRAGDVVRAAETTKSGVAEPAVGSQVAVRYDPDRPTRVVLETSHTARNVTLWIVAVKLVVGGVVLAVLAWRRLGRPDGDAPEAGEPVAAA
jgi:hypothetical protein